MYGLIKNMMFCMQPETAHEFAMFFLKRWHKFPILQDTFTYQNDVLKNNIFQLEFENPVGIAAGFDKNAVVLNALSHLGFGFLEFGAVTPKPQLGNPKPRLFRLKTENSLQNAMGFNNLGMKTIKQNLENQYKIYEKTHIKRPPIFANIGKNKDTQNENAMSDYEMLVDGLSDFCDGFVVNISSPNTKNLRDLQNDDFVENLFMKLCEKTTKPILLKIAPDMQTDQAISVCKSAVKGGSQGIIIANTTQEYSLSKESTRNFGGLSGRVLKDKARKLLLEISKELYGKTTIISVGGIEDSDDVFWRLRHGASLVQIYTSFIYKGPAICKIINQELAKKIKYEGVNNIKDIIGSAL